IFWPSCFEECPAGGFVCQRTSGHLLSLRLASQVLGSPLYIPWSSGPQVDRFQEEVSHAQETRDRNAGRVLSGARCGCSAGTRPRQAWVRGTQLPTPILRGVDLSSELR